MIPMSEQQTQPSFESALQQLEQLVKELEQGDIELNEAVAKYNEGMKLSKYCHDLLANAEQAIVQLMKEDQLTDFDE
jgi:exodeoxyribonuclease VII small subunit